MTDSPRRSRAAPDRDHSPRWTRILPGRSKALRVALVLVLLVQPVSAVGVASPASGGAPGGAGAPADAGPGDEVPDAGDAPSDTPETDAGSVDEARRAPAFPGLETGLSRWSQRLPTAAEPLDASGPDEYVPALRRYVEALGAELDEGELADARAQAAAMDPAQREALADLLNVLVARDRIARDVFANASEGPDPAGVTAADHARLAASQRAAAAAVADVAAAFPQPSLDPATTTGSSEDPAGAEAAEPCVDEPGVEACHDGNGTRACLGNGWDTDCAIGASKRPGESPKACVDEGLDTRAGCEAKCDGDGAQGPDVWSPDETPETGPVATCGAGPLPEVQVCRAVLVNLNSRDNAHGRRWDSTDCEPPSFAFQFDLAGDDFYRSNAGGAGLVHAENKGLGDDWLESNPHYHPSALAVDLFGDDTYKNMGKAVKRSNSNGQTWYSYAGWGAWAGAGLLGVGGLVDLRGQDEYRHGRCAVAGTGSGTLGSGVLVDAAGHDRYVSAVPGEEDWYCHRAEIQTRWKGLPSAITGSVAVAGTGLLLDVAGSDEYHASDATCQWVPQVDHRSVCHGSAVGTDPEEPPWWDSISTWNDFLPGQTSLGTAAGALVDVAGDDTYRGTNGAVVTAYEADEDTKVDLADEGCDFGLWGYSWRLGRSCTARAGEVPDSSPAALLDLSGGDVYRGANGFGGLLYDAQGSDLYRDDLQPTTLPPFYTGEAEEPVGDESWTPKPMGTTGAQIDDTPVEAPGSSSSWLTSPANDVGNDASRACTPGADRTDLDATLQVEPVCSEPAAKAGGVGDCATDVTEDVEDDVDDPGCEAAGTPDAGGGPNETDPQADSGRVFWLEGRKLMMQDVYTQGETPRVLAYDAVDYRASPTLVAWVDNDGNLIVYDRVDDERRYLTTPDCYGQSSPYECYGGPDDSRQFKADCEGTYLDASEDVGDDDAYLFDVDGRNVVWAGTTSFGTKFFQYGATDEFVHCLDRYHRISDRLYQHPPRCVDDLRISRHRIACVAEGGDGNWDCLDRGVVAYTIRRVEAKRDRAAIQQPLRCHPATEVAIDASVVAWIGDPWNENEEVVSAVDLDELAPQPESPGPHRVYQVGTTGGLEEGVAVSGSTILWNKAVCGDPLIWETEEEVCEPGTSVVGRDIGHLRHGQELCKRGVRYQEDCPAGSLFPGHLIEKPEAPTKNYCFDGDNWCGTDDQPIPVVSLGGAEFVVSDPGRDRRSAVDPEASRNVVTWTVCEAEANGSRCPEGRTDVRYAYVVGPEVAGDRVVGGLAQCWNTAESGDTPSYLKSREVGSPDLDDDGLGDCWASHHAQIVNDALDLASDLDCDRLNNLAEFRWDTHPIYDVPPEYALSREACSGAVPTETATSTAPVPHHVVYPHGRDLDMDFLVDGYEARYIARAHGEEATMDVGDAGDAALNATHGVALYHPLKDHDSDGDGVRDMEDLHSDSQVSDENPATDTIPDGIEVWLLDTFPDHGDSDCGAEADVCHGSQAMVPEDQGDAESSPSRGTGDGLPDHRELYMWLVDFDGPSDVHDRLYFQEDACQADDGDPGATGECDAIDNALLDPSADGDEVSDIDECKAALDNGYDVRACEPGFEPTLWWVGDDAPPGRPPQGGLGDGLTLQEIADRWRDDPGDDALNASSSEDASGTPCPSPRDPDSDDDGVLDGTEMGAGADPCDPDSVPPHRTNDQGVDA